MEKINEVVKQGIDMEGAELDGPFYSLNGDQENRKDEASAPRKYHIGDYRRDDEGDRKDVYPYSSRTLSGTGMNHHKTPVVSPSGDYKDELPTKTSAEDFSPYRPCSLISPPNQASRRPSRNKIFPERYSPESPGVLIDASERALVNVLEMGRSDDCEPLISSMVLADEGNIRAGTQTPIPCGKLAGSRKQVKQSQKSIGSISSTLRQKRRIEKKLKIKLQQDSRKDWTPEKRYLAGIADADYITWAGKKSPVEKDHCILLSKEEKLGGFKSEKEKQDAAQKKKEENRIEANMMPVMIMDEKELSFRRSFCSLVNRNQLVEDPVLYEQKQKAMNPWTPEEKMVFSEKLTAVNKNFIKIASFLPHKTTADCVEYYYRGDFEKGRRRQKPKKKKYSTFYLATTTPGNHIGDDTGDDTGHRAQSTQESARVFQLEMDCTGLQVSGKEFLLRSEGGVPVHLLSSTVANLEELRYIKGKEAWEAAMRQMAFSDGPNRQENEHEFPAADLSSNKHQDESDNSTQDEDLMARDDNVTYLKKVKAWLKGGSTQEADKYECPSEDVEEHQGEACGCIEVGCRFSSSDNVKLDQAVMPEGAQIATLSENRVTVPICVTNEQDMSYDAIQGSQLKEDYLQDWSVGLKRRNTTGKYFGIKYKRRRLLARHASTYNLRNRSKRKDKTVQEATHQEPPVDHQRTRDKKNDTKLPEAAQQEALTDTEVPDPHARITLPSCTNLLSEFDALRRSVGDDVFKAALKEFRNRH